MYKNVKEGPTLTINSNDPSHIRFKKRVWDSIRYDYDTDSWYIKGDVYAEYWDKGAWKPIDDKSKPSAKLLAYLSPLLPILVILKNNPMSKRGFFNPINWLK